VHHYLTVFWSRVFVPVKEFNTLIAHKASVFDRFLPCHAPTGAVLPP